MLPACSINGQGNRPFYEVSSAKHKTRSARVSSFFPKARAGHPAFFQISLALRFNLWLKLFHLVSIHPFGITQPALQAIVAAVLHRKNVHNGLR